MSGELLLAAIAAYFCGAIPFGVLVGTARGVDVRAVGSGNSGATNVWRTLGPVAGTLVFLLDAGKGWLAVWFARELLYDFHQPQSTWQIAMCAALVVLGHTFSVFLKFRGGKGIATAFGAMLAIVPLVALGCIALWAIVLLMSRTISVASIVACIATPIGLVWTRAPLPYGTVVILLAMVAIWKHIPNMKRIISGTEPKIGRKKTVIEPEISPAIKGAAER